MALHALANTLTKNKVLQVHHSEDVVQMVAGDTVRYKTVLSRFMVSVITHDEELRKIEVRNSAQPFLAWMPRFLWEGYLKRIVGGCVGEC